MDTTTGEGGEDHLDGDFLIDDEISDQPMLTFGNNENKIFLIKSI